MSNFRPSTQVSRCPGRLGRNLARPRTCQDGQNTCQLSALVWWEKSDSRLQLRCRPMRISAGSDSLPAEFLRGRGGGKQARIVRWQLTNIRSRLQHCLNPPTWGGGDYLRQIIALGPGMCTHAASGRAGSPRKRCRRVAARRSRRAPPATAYVTPKKFLVAWRRWQLFEV